MGFRLPRAGILRSNERGDEKHQLVTLCYIYFRSPATHLALRLIAAPSGSSILKTGFWTDDF